MSESFSNTNSSAYTAPAIQPAGTNASQVVANNQTPAGQTTVPVGEESNNVAETPKKTSTVTTTGTEFDTNNNPDFKIIEPDGKLYHHITYKNIYQG